MMMARISRAPRRLRAGWQPRRSEPRQLLTSDRHADDDTVWDDEATLSSHATGKLLAVNTTIQPCRGAFTTAAASGHATSGPKHFQTK